MPNTRYWWKLAKPVHAFEQYRLQVRFRGGEAGDVDFEVGLPDGTGGDVTGAVVSAGECDHYRGYDEDCTTFLTDEGDALYVITGRGDTGAEEFQMILTAVTPGQGGPADCTSLPTNTSPATAAPIHLGQPVIGKHCPVPNTRYWWKLDQSVQAYSQYRLQVHFRGEDAGDVDFKVGLPDVTGRDVTGAVVSAGECDHYRGYDEDCNAFLTAGGDGLYVVTGSNDTGAEEFQMVLTPVSTGPGGPADCTSLPTNTSPATAAPIALGQTTTGKHCPVPNTRYWWKLDQAVQAYSQYQLQVHFRGEDAGDVDFKMGLPDVTGRDVTGAVVSAGECDHYRGYDEDCNAFLTAGGDGLYVVTGSNDTGAEEFQMILTPVSTGPGAPADCTSLPTNISPSMAAPIHLGQPVMGKHCPVPNTHYWWKLDQAVQAYSQYRLQVHFRGGDAGDVDFKVGFPDSTGGDVSGAVVSAGECDHYRGYDEDCNAFLTAGGDGLYVVTRSNDTGAEEFQMILTPVSTGPGGPADCTVLPSNTSPATATPIFLGQATTGKHCPLPNTRYWWKLDQAVQSYSKYRLQVRFRGDDAGDVDFAVGLLDATGRNVTGAVVSAGECDHYRGYDEDCTNTLNADGNALFVVTAAGDTGAEEFLLTLTAVQ